MSDETNTSPVSVEDPEVTYCHGHPKTPTRLRCTRCDKPICGRCAVPASVGQHCVWCVAEAAKSAPKVKSALQANSPVVMGIIGISVLLWLAQSISGLTTPGLDPVSDRLAAFAPAIATGEWWRLLSAMFLHLPLGGGIMGILHIVFNMYILRMYGPQIEEAFGRVRFIALYLVMGFGGSAVSYAFGGCRPSLGASGAVFGLFGFLIVYLYRRRASVIAAGYMRSLLTLVAINLFLGFVYPGVDNLAHLGGLATGLGLGAAVDNGKVTQRPAWIQAAGVVVIVAIGVALVMARTSGFSCAAPGIG